MAWYPPSRSAPVLTALGSRAWDEARTNSRLVICACEAFGNFVKDDEEYISVVFANEGTFNDGVFNFHYEYSDRSPLIVSKFIAFKINVILFEMNRITQKQFDEVLAGEEGRKLFLAIVAKALEDEDGGTPNRGPGNALAPQFEHEEEEV